MTVTLYWASLADDPLQGRVSAAGEGVAEVGLIAEDYDARRVVGQRTGKPPL